MLALTGCGTTAPPAAAVTVRPQDLHAADFYPLDAGWRWAYDIEKDGQKMLAMYTALERTADTATVQAGDDRLSYAITPEGIAQRDGTMRGDFVIKNPVAAGTTWEVLGGKAKIVSIGQEVSTDAGKFPNCAIVEVTRTSPTRVARTTFAPGVGPIVIELQVQSGGSFVTVTRATLRALTRPGEDPLLGH
jgi:hypothetical protein